MTSANPAITHTSKNKALNPLLKDKIKHMQNKKPHEHSTSEQQADISWWSHGAVNKSITNLHNYRKSSKNLKPFFPFSYTTCCASPVDMTQGRPHSPPLSQCYSHLFKTSIYSQIIWLFAFVLNIFATINGLFSSPTFLNYTPLDTQDLSLILSTCSDFAFIFHAYVHQMW